MNGLSISAVLRGLGHDLPPVSGPAGAYAAVIEDDGMLYLSGQISRRADGQVVTGKIGAELSIDHGRQAALLSALQLMAQIDRAVGSHVGSVRQVLKLTGFVNCERDFASHSAVIDAASELFVSVFGSAGTHSRSSVGVYALPRDASVEIEAVVRLRQ